MKYCKKCVLPDSRPNLIIGTDGICNACKNSNEKKEINWKERERSLLKVIEKAKKRSKGYDCLIPVSGGKDSTWQVIKCLEYGLNPLSVTWKTPARTFIGQKNLDNLVQLGVDHIDYQINPKVERKFLYQSFKKFGSTAIPMHMALFSIPLKIAVKFNIPLVIWGENSAFEYGSKKDESKGFQLNIQWIKDYGVTHGTTAKDWVSENLTAKELTPYFCPNDEELKTAAVNAIFLGYYLKWDPLTSLKISQKNGFMSSDKGPKVGFYDYADIDDDFISIHHWLKWYKFGFTRTYDNLSLEIRNGRMTRSEAINIILKKEDETPFEDIEKFCKFLSISKKHFFEIAEKFRNNKIWFKEKRIWKIRDYLLNQPF